MARKETLTNPSTTIPSKYITLEQARQEGWGSVTTLRRRISEGRLTAYRRGRLVFVMRHDLAALYEPVAVSEEEQLAALARKIVAQAPKLHAKDLAELAALLTN